MFSLHTQPVLQRYISAEYFQIAVEFCIRNLFNKISRKNPTKSNNAEHKWKICLKKFLFFIYSIFHSIKSIHFNSRLFFILLLCFMCSFFANFIFYIFYTFCRMEEWLGIYKIHKIYIFARCYHLSVAIVDIVGVKYIIFQFPFRLEAKFCSIMARVSFWMA